MALGHSPQTVTNGLVFYYDMGNPQKSWKGAPTTNLISNSLPSSTTGYTPSGGTGFLVYDSNLQAINWVRISYETWGAYITVDPMFNGNLDTLSQYTISFEWKTENTAVANSAYSYNLVQGNGVSAAASANILSNSVLQQNGWYLFKYTFTPANTGVSAYNRVVLSSQGTNVSTFYWRKIQLEKIGFATPYVNGTRSNTQAVLDLTNNNTITANALTYNSNGTFGFNGSSNLITFPENSAFNTQTPTVEVWVKTNATTQNGFWFEKGTVNSQYALFQEGANITWRHTTNVASLVAPAASFINTAQYAQVVGTYTPGSRQIYVNGVQVASDTLNYTIPTNASGCSIGVYGGFSGSRGYYYNGNIDIVKVYNRALSAAEVQQNFNALRGRYGL
jgi:hypothetical protein